MAKVPDDTRHLKQFMKQDKGQFNLSRFYNDEISVHYSLSAHATNWQTTTHLTINASGELRLHNQPVDHLQACYVQITDDLEPVLLVKTFALDTKIHLRVARAAASGIGSERTEYQLVFLRLLAALMVWQNLKPRGIVHKLYTIPKKLNPLAKEHEMLVCRFKVYAPLPKKQRNVNIVHGGPKIPSYSSPQTPDATEVVEEDAPECWFYAMGVLTTKGIMKILTELDGKLIYTIDVKQLYQSEIQKLHRSVVDNTSSRVLLIGVLRDLRQLSQIKNVTPLGVAEVDASAAPFLVSRDKKRAVGHAATRILVEFPLYMDLEDWFVGLNYFTRKELYMGTVLNHQLGPSQVPAGLRAPLVHHTNHSDSSLSSAEGYAPPPMLRAGGLGRKSIGSTPRQSFESDNSAAVSSKQTAKFRIARKVALDVIEATFNDESMNLPNFAGAKLYAEIVIWGLPWFRTSIVANNVLNNPFWKECFEFGNLPLSTQYFQIFIKESVSEGSSGESSESSDEDSYSVDDYIDSYMDNGSTNSPFRPKPSKTIPAPQVKATDEYSSSDRVLGTVYITPDLLLEKSKHHQEIRLSIYDSRSLDIGKILVRIDISEHHILLPSRASFQLFETMLGSLPLSQLIDFVNNSYMNSKVNPVLVSNGENMEAISMVFLDIFQSLRREDEWFKCLMDEELVSVAKLLNSKNPVMNNNVFNTFLRGNSILTKSLEKFNYRVGQEYLEKLLSGFVAKINRENKNCEIDPRQFNHLGTNDKEAVLAENFQNLHGYVNELWSMIYRTSNDLPKPIRKQLGQFRSKIDFLVMDSLQGAPGDSPTQKTNISLNCLTSFIFLRFFCPAILNPKLFHLIKDHQTGQVQRTLTLIAKILLTLSNCSRFPAHKEPYLIPFNKYVEDHETEVVDYFDKLTGKKNDFSEKVLELSDEIARFDLNIVGDSENNADYLSHDLLPSTPYLIDKYLRFSELINMLTFQDDLDAPSGAATPTGGHIGTLAFEKKNETTEFDAQDVDLVPYEDENETFLKSLLHSNEDLLQFLHVGENLINIGDLCNQGKIIRRKTTILNRLLEDHEKLHFKPSSAEEFYYKSKRHSSIITCIDDESWFPFVEYIAQTAFIDVVTRNVVYGDRLEASSRLKKLAVSGLSGLKLKYPSMSYTQVSTRGLVTPSGDSTPLSPKSKERVGRFKRLFGRRPNTA